MKKQVFIYIIGFLITVLTAVEVKAQKEQEITKKKGIEFYHGSWNEILEKSRKENKLIFLDAYASWCFPCKMMAQNVFTNKKVGAYFNEHFINVKMDMEKGIGPELARKYKLTAYPTLYFVDSHGNLKSVAVGYRTASELIEIADLVLAK